MEFYFAFCTLLISFKSLLIKGAEGGSNPETQETTMHVGINGDKFQNRFTDSNNKIKIQIFIDSLKEEIKKLHVNDKMDCKPSTSDILKKLFAPNKKLVQIFREKGVLFYDNQEELCKGLEEVAYKFNNTLYDISFNEVGKVESSYDSSVKKKYTGMVGYDKESFYFPMFDTFYVLVHTIPFSLILEFLNTTKDSEEFNKGLILYIEKTHKFYENAVKETLCLAKSKYENNSYEFFSWDLQGLKKHCLRLNFTFFSLIFNFYEILLKNRKSETLNEDEYKVLKYLMIKFTRSTISNKYFLRYAERRIEDLMEKKLKI